MLETRLPLIGLLAAASFFLVQGTAQGQCLT
jgi:hypothetical protein